MTALTEVEERKKPGRRKQLITMAIGLVVMVAVFAFLFPNIGNYQQAFAKLAELGPIWIAALIAAGILNIAVFPLTAMAAIPHLGYRPAFVNRQVGFVVSNIIPGGGAVAVGTQYTILTRYGVPSALCAAAVAADAVWTYLIALGFPAIAVGLLVLEGRSTTGFVAIAVAGLVIVAVSISAIAITLRSETGAERIARIAQRPTDAVCRLIRRPAPDLRTMLVDFHEQASDLVGNRWLPLTATNLAAQLTPMVVLWVALAGMGAYPDPLTLVEVFAAYAIALVLASFPITPGGLGTVDAALVGLLVAFGVDSSTALAADLVWRLVWFLPQLLVGLGALGMYWWDRRRDARRNLG